jgi:hypothetical protein
MKFGDLLISFEQRQIPVLDLLGAAIFALHFPGRANRETAT